MEVAESPTQLATGRLKRASSYSSIQHLLVVKSLLEKLIAFHYAHERRRWHAPLYFEHTGYFALLFSWLTAGHL